MLLFDSPRYFDLLGWLGRPVTTPAGSAVLRRFDGFHWDARGSWPYQSLPSIEQLQALRDLPGFSPLSFTSVIRPDANPEVSGVALGAIREHFRTEFRTLKVHLGHSPSLPQAREGYSRRTRRRLNHAASVFFVEREDMFSDHEVISYPFPATTITPSTGSPRSMRIVAPSKDATARPAVSRSRRM